MKYLVLILFCSLSFFICLSQTPKDTTNLTIQIRAKKIVEKLNSCAKLSEAQSNIILQIAEQREKLRINYANTSAESPGRDSLVQRIQELNNEIDSQLTDEQKIAIKTEQDLFIKERQAMLKKKNN